MSDDYLRNIREYLQILTDAELDGLIKKCNESEIIDQAFLNEAEEERRIRLKFVKLQEE